jgi:hypothetical protein
MYIYLVDEVYTSLHEELKMYKQLLEDITIDKKIPTWECSICREEKKYFDPRCCCSNCGELTCVLCKGKISVNKIIKCPFCTCEYIAKIHC